MALQDLSCSKKVFQSSLRVELCLNCFLSGESQLAQDLMRRLKQLARQLMLLQMVLQRGVAP